MPVEGIAHLQAGGTIAAMYITQEHNQWPQTLPRIAARLRQVLDLPGLTVHTHRNHLAISWVGGPAAEPVYAELEDRLWHVAAYRAVRLYPVAVFGAALLTGCRPPLYNRHFDAAWQLLHHRDLRQDRLDDELMTQGTALAAMTGAPATAVVGRSRRRWDWDMWLVLQRLGDPCVLQAICAPATP